MSSSVSFHTQLASILEVLAKSALAEITKLVDDGSAALRLEMCRSQRENETLKRKLLRMERELRAVRGYGDETPDNSLNISFEVQVCDELGEAHRHNATRLTPGKITREQGESCGSISMKTEEAGLQPTVIKREPVDWEHDWPESLLLNEDGLEVDPRGGQSQVEQKMSEENTCGTFRPAAVDIGEGPLYEEELQMPPCVADSPEKELLVELKQDPEGWPLAPPPSLRRVQRAWSETGGLGRAPLKPGQPGGKDKRKEAQVNLDCPDEFLRATPGKKFIGRNASCDPGDEDCKVDSEASSPVGSFSGGDEEPFRTLSPETDLLTPAGKNVSQGRRKLYNKKQYCLYCQKGYSKISRHLEHVHRHEPEVVNALRFPKNSKERHVRLTKLRNQGNFVHNSRVASTGTGELVLRRRVGPKQEPSAFEYCPYCKGLYAKLLLWRHVKSCDLRTKEGENDTLKFGELGVPSFWDLSGPCPLDVSEEAEEEPGLWDGGRRVEMSNTTPFRDSDPNDSLAKNDLG